ncbi:MAG: sigma-70 family RNA polymerase sigma factor [Candidatus Omnitrophica bacterium]|nr:sigma-70 family RNA polymerase sigma factor [Candidatus Omnitrophota bacterium]
MQELILEQPESLVHVQEEPALEIALPQVFIQPELTALQRGQLPHLEGLIARLYRSHVQGSMVLGLDYQALVNEFQPLFTWAVACWDYLLSTEGCRFVLRNGEERYACRGDYRVVTDRDYSRLTHRIFRQCVFEFAHTACPQSFAGYLRTHFWDAVLLAYRKLEDPPDLRQRKLTAYSYLRCIPYRFFKAYHHELVARVLRALPSEHHRVLERYFLHFETLPAAAQHLELPLETSEERLRSALTTLLIHHRLTYCLLRQIERY